MSGRKQSTRQASRETTLALWPNPAKSVFGTGGAFASSVGLRWFFWTELLGAQNSRLADSVLEWWRPREWIGPPKKGSTAWLEIGPCNLSLWSVCAYYYLTMQQYFLAAGSECRTSCATFSSRYMQAVHFGHSSCALPCGR